MPRLLRRRLRCHYCNSYSQSPQGGIPRSWQCPQCEAVNHLDERGEIIHPPVEATTTAAQFSFARSRSPTPRPPPPGESPFCDTCQRNQMLVNKTLAEYLPDEDDPQYEKYEASADAYRAELEQRYPQVCDTCIGRVRDHIRAAGYAAKTDNLRRVLEQSNRQRVALSPPKEEWTVHVVNLAKWVYIFSISVGLTWHTSGLVSSFDVESLDEELSVSQSMYKQVGHICSAFFTSSSVVRLVQAAAVADLLSIWWNPKVARRTARVGGRMRGLKTLWFARFMVHALRIALLLPWTHSVFHQDPRWFTLMHGVAVFSMLLTVFMTWNSISIVYPSVARPVDEQLPSVPGSAERIQQREYKPVRPDHSTFDTMAAAFTSSFSEPNAYHPPSPTLTATSFATEETATTTPYSRRKSIMTEASDTMDWTPTQKRFASQVPDILPPIWDQPSPSVFESPSKRQPHSIFAKKDPNPFHHKVPAAPKAPAQARIDPWNPVTWSTTPKDTRRNLFREEREQLGVPPAGPAAANVGIGVPKNVQRDADIFQSPKLKYDYYGRPKETGLEGSFNDLFSK